MKLKIWGTRGDIPAPERDKLKYGGNTQCLEIISKSSDTKIYIDAGIGLMNAGRVLDPACNNYHILLTHYHWDHIQGILPFVPFFIPKNNIYIYGYAHSERELKDYLQTLYLYVFSPLRTIDYYSAKVHFIPILVGDELKIDGISFLSFQLEHGDKTLGFKVSDNGKSFVLASDHEARDSSSLNEKLAKLAQGTNLLIHDSIYNNEDYIKGVTTGHSSISMAISTAKKAGLKRVALIDYNPRYSDNDIDVMIKKASDENPDFKIVGLREGMEINF
jgi:phosphoribosyl 1,2-cyclic phosphodiesterase